jgi:hypothetical protein
MEPVVAQPDGPALPSQNDSHSGAMCPNLPSRETQMCPNLPPPERSKPLERAQTCPDLPEGAPGERENAGRGTNPIRAHGNRRVLRPLSDKQLAAARWVVCGFGSKAIARRLGVNHHTVGTWKRDPRFVALVAELRARADASAVAFTARSTVIAADGSPQSAVPERGAAMAESRGLPAAATNNPLRGAGSVADRILAQVMQQRGELEI